MPVHTVNFAFNHGTAVLLFILASIMPACSRDATVSLPGAFTTLPIHHRITLHEDSSVALGSIRSATVSPSGTRLLVCDNAKGVAFVFNLRDGALLKVLKGTTDLSDSLARKVRPHSDSLRFLYRSEFNDTAGRPLSPRELAYWLNNTFNNGYFDSDSTLVLSGTLQGVLQNTRGPFKRVSWGQTSLFSYNLNSGAIRVFPVDMYGSSLMTTDAIAPPTAQCGMAITSSMDQNALEHRNFTSAATLSCVDSNGTITRSFFPLPSQFRNAALGYNAFFVSLTKTGDGNLLAVCSMLPSVYNLTTGHSFRIDRISHVNDSGFAASHAPVKNIQEFTRRFHCGFPASEFRRPEHISS
jgi:WD40 repeat protein